MGLFANRRRGRGGLDDLGTKKDGRKLLTAEVMQKVPESVVQERMTKGKEVRGIKGKKKVRGWSIEEMEDKVDSLVEMDTGEMLKWRALSQEGIDRSMLEEFGGKMEVEVLNRYKIDKK